MKNENVTVDGKSVKSSEILVKDMLNLRDCYDKLGKTDEEITILNEALTYDSVNTNVIYYLIQLYGDNKNYKSMSELYDTVSADENVTKDVLSLFKNYACQDPVITPAEGEYSKSQTVGFCRLTDVRFTIQWMAVTLLKMEVFILRILPLIKKELMNLSII